MENINVRPLSKDLQLKAIKELNEDPKTIRADIEKIKKWLNEQSHLNMNPDDQFILTFLRGCKFNHETTKQKLELFYTTKSRIPELLSNRNPLSPDIQRVLKSKRFWFPLPRFSNPLVPRLLFSNGEPFKPSEKIEMHTIIKVMLIVLDILLHEDDSFIVNGYSVIHYVDGFSVSHLTQLTLKFLKDSYTCMVKRYPVRLKGFYFMNSSSSLYTLISIAKSFLSRKIHSRIKFCKSNDLTKIYDIYPKEELPIELGGEHYSVQTVFEEWRTKIEEHGSWLINDKEIK